MNNHFSGFAGQIFPNSQSIPKMIEVGFANIRNMGLKRQHKNWKQLLQEQRRHPQHLHKLNKNGLKQYAE